MEALKELVQFMQPTQRLDLKAVALTHVLGLTGTAEGRNDIHSMQDMLIAIFGLTLDANHSIAKDAVLALINLTADSAGARNIVSTALHPPYPLVETAVKCIIDENSQLADAWTMVLSNITRVESLVHGILNELALEEDKTLLQLIQAFTKIDYNKKQQKLHYLAPMFCNLTQSSRGREIFTNSKFDLLDKILPFVHYADSVVRRGGSIGIIKNICFDPIYHEIILNDKDDMLVALLSPLCGPEEFDDEENDKFPIELQYLPESKTREEDPDLRKMLLESLLQLCATKRCRQQLRDKGVYELLREYHKWEAKHGQDNECLLACENVVDILIKKEEEIGLDNYKAIEVPHEYFEKFVAEEYDKSLVD